MEDNLKTSEIWVTKFDEESSRKFRESVVAISKNDPAQPIIIYIDSYGGSVDSLATMIETLDEIPNPIITACVGKAMSCAAILLSHGDFRMCGKHSRIMIHEVSSGTFGDVHDMHADVVEAKRLNEHFMGLLAKNCGFSSYNDIRKLIKEQDGRDRYMNAKQALEFGIIDAIGLPKISTSIIHEIGVVPEKPKRKIKNNNNFLKLLKSKKNKSKSESKK